MPKVSTNVELTRLVDSNRKNYGVYKYIKKKTRKNPYMDMQKRERCCLNRPRRLDRFPTKVFEVQYFSPADNGKTQVFIRRTKRGSGFCLKEIFRKLNLETLYLFTMGRKISISLFYKLFAVPTYLFAFKAVRQQSPLIPSIFYIYQACIGSNGCIRIELKNKKKYTS